ncbi:hypothetical protein EA187_08055 [Lujinxingia sediminis]|uniref:Uncharacterized protein n=1 Tax=Lujinxingia sediminis TaxID=2480984 RepID=A0ABY0CU57_9DELT|nr:hypothetical protein [Lujinxingia sediminis]RVU45710.1 hypothetical protein EA187_08055 [Lujinxingia sediminis]
MIGCSEAPDTEPGAALARTHSPLFASPPYTLVGQGVTPSGNGYEAQGHYQCIPEVKRMVQAAGGTESVGTIVSTSTEVKERLNLLFNGELKIAGSSVADLEGKLDEMQGTRKDFSAAVIIGLIRTVDRVAIPQPARADANGDPLFEDGSLCDPKDPNHPEDLAAAVDNCGTHYVDREQLGGMVVFVADLTKLSTEEREEIGGKIGGDIPLNESATLDLSLNATLERLNNSRFNQLVWSTRTYGFVNGPDIPPPGEWFAELPSAWMTYLDEIADDVAVALANDAWEAAAYGRVLNYTTAPYDQVLYNWCGFDFGITGLECIQDFETLAQPALDPTGDLTGTYESVVWKLDNPSRVLWPAPQADAIDAYENFRGKFEDCQANFEIQRATCFDSVQDAVDNLSSPTEINDAVCGKCDVEPGCAVDQFVALANQLPTAEVFAPGRPYDPFTAYFGNNEDGKIAKVDGWICTLSGMGGQFAGLGERVTLGTEFDSTTNEMYWHGRSDSGRTEVTERVFSEYNCVPRSIFTDTTGSGDWISEPVQTFTIDEEEEIDQLGYRSKAFSVAGIGGSLKGFGERAVVEHPSGTSTVDYRIKSEQGPFFASFMGFGLWDAANTQMAFWSSPQGADVTAEVITTSEGEPDQRVANLAPVSQAFCFLAEISGKFDGGREYVRVVPTRTHWQLIASAAPNKPVRAVARCVYYDQS